MNFVKHSELEGQHAFLSPSKYHWINYSVEEMISHYKKFIASARGTKLHAIAKELIEEKIKLPNTKNTFNMYVNDAIGFQMTPEVPLFYSKYCFGCADTISFDRNKNFLRIHDLKTGVEKAHMEQLEVYTSVFCLEYKKDIKKINVELRLYQTDKVLIHEPNCEKIEYIMNKIITFDKEIEKISKEEEYSV